jgi:hypothetical protein
MTTKENYMASGIMAQPKAIAWEVTLQKVVLIVTRLMLAYLFFTQLFWKMPPTFGCPDDFAFTTANAEGKLQRSKGLCDWIGVESVWSERPRSIFAANLDNTGQPEIALDISFLAQANGAFLKNVVMPNIRWFGYVIWGMEAFIFVSLFLGIFSRLGGLVGMAQSAQLAIGLAGITSPNEFEWTYHLMVVASLVAFAFAPGRYLGLDSIMRPLLQRASDRGNGLAGLLLWLT